MSIRRKLIIGGLLLAFVAFYATNIFFGCFRSFFRAVSIDPRTLLVTPQQPIFYNGFPVGAPLPSGQFYSIFRNDVGDLSLDHQGPHSTRYGAFSMNSNYLLDGRSKQQELLRGPFGTVYANTKWVYSHPTPTGQISFDVSPYANGEAHEPAQVMSSLPRGLPLDVVSVIRILHLPQGYSPNDLVVAVGTYGATGPLRTLTFNIARNGDWVSGSILSGFPASFGFSGATGPNLVRYGFPAVFPVAQYERRPSPVWSAMASDTLTVVSLHYARNQWVRQDSYAPASARKTRYLTYAITLEDVQLKPLDITLPFNQDPSKHED